MNAAARSRLYSGTVFHRRLRPRVHALSYRVFYMLLDLDELPALSRCSRLFAHNRFSLFSFHDSDHGDGSGRPLRLWIEAQLARAGIETGGGRIEALCLPRVLGHVFNPLTVYFCHRADDGLVAMLYEVNNTFGDRHSYLIPVETPQASIVAQACDKAFYVSPFLPVAGRYHFKVLRPGARLALTIRESDEGGAMLTASFAGTAHAFDDRQLALAFLRHPLLTLKVVGGIHWEALRLWLKGIKLAARPAAPSSPVTIVPFRDRSPAAPSRVTQS
ncbi:MAG: DUF1365 domain-containing protein [Parvibaculum sp.]|uniref:DUF1365 domain-containing protein n=1 Tax=Parvibaculum sp. TaxID=2024848 RepID=UPI0034A08697